MRTTIRYRPEIDTQVSGIEFGWLSGSGLRKDGAIPISQSMWEYLKSQLHQSAIDKMKPEPDRAAARAVAAEVRLRRERDAIQAVKDHEATRVATLAKTQRLRATRLALLDAKPTKPKQPAGPARRFPIRY